MESYERIKYLRKKVLNMSQNEFSRQINISRSNLGNIETNKVNLTERVLTDICRTFQVNRAWIMDGTEPMFDEASSALDEKLLRLYAELTEENQKYLYGYLQRLLDEQEHSKKQLRDPQR